VSEVKPNKDAHEFLNQFLQEIYFSTVHMSMAERALWWCTFLGGIAGAMRAHMGQAFTIKASESILEYAHEPTGDGSHLVDKVKLN